MIGGHHGEPGSGPVRFNALCYLVRREREKVVRREALPRVQPTSPPSICSQEGRKGERPEPLAHAGSSKGGDARMPVGARHVAPAEPQPLRTQVESTRRSVARRWECAAGLRARHAAPLRRHGSPLTACARGAKVRSAPGLASPSWLPAFLSQDCQGPPIAREDASKAARYGSCRAAASFAAQGPGEGVVAYPRAASKIRRCRQRGRRSSRRLWRLEDVSPPGKVREGGGANG